MGEIKQRTFRLPIILIEKWDEFNPDRSKEKSRNAAGALLLYTFMPAHIRDIIRDLAYEENLQDARRLFFERLNQYHQNFEFAKAIVAAAQAQELTPAENPADKP